VSQVRILPRAQAGAKFAWDADFSRLDGQDFVQNEQMFRDVYALCIDASG
jgi:hypothetical protein